MFNKLVTMMVLVLPMTLLGACAPVGAPTAAPTAVLATPALATILPAPTDVPTALPSPTDLPTASPSAGGSSMRTRYPLTVTDCGGHTFTFSAAPKTPVTLDAQAYELMFWLGLGQAQIAAGPQPLPAVPDQFKEQTKTVKTLERAPNAAYVSKEALLGAKPDFVFGSYESGFKGEAVFSEEELAAKGINAYWSFGIGGCKDDDPQAPRANLDATLRDIENLGKIFDVQEQAMTLGNQLREDLKQALALVGSGKKMRVATFEIGEYADGKPGIFGATSTVNAIITLAGGVNAFGDVPGAYLQTNWEEYIKRDPEVILLVAYPAAAPQAWDDAEKLLTEMPSLQNVSAIKNKRFVRVTFPEVGAGGVRNVDAVKKLAQVLATAGGN